MIPQKYRPGGPLEVALFVIAALMVVGIAVGVALGHIKPADVPVLLAIPGGLVTAFGIPKSISLGKFGHLSLAGLEDQLPNVEAVARSLKTGNIVGAIALLETALPATVPPAVETDKQPPEPTPEPPAAQPPPSGTAHDQTEPAAPTAAEVAAAQDTLNRAAQAGTAT